ncbi:aldehyde dehydrogenase family protein [Bdellovibrio sp. ZAP7]|uniref:aldehyde dehydrogenase family protein n=1 Tax=Bdellovibrio sp. ZAP7 TaxID=2231053 RepID=UPI001157B02F|nr:aldehyde dehydrogenase family protein [Bdellovibrio sp. ZAP7]QDK45852.1 aldehyde dehydrogenase family protein [Bdellovibrio sp. ZAP7]
MLEQLVLRQKSFAQHARTESWHQRYDYLESLKSMITDHQQELCKALYEDFKKPELESLATEIMPLLKEIRFAQKHLKKWMKPQRVCTPLLLFGSKSYTRFEALGSCLIISPWNYPLYLTIAPLVSALAAGNAAVIKPSEYAPHTSRLMHSLLSKYFKPEQVSVIEGGPETTTELLKQAFDHVFFTGSTEVGRIIMKGAAHSLARVTLELGGKSPTVIDNTANLKLAAQKIIWAKFVNAGQTCVAPDYLFIQESIHHEFLQTLKVQLQESFGSSKDDVKSSKSFARIINRRHTDRLKGLLEDAISNSASVVAGGEVDLEQNYVAPTLLDNVDPHTKVMNEEIFGPILPILKFKDISEVVHFINERPKPLTIYCYSHSEHNIKKLMKETSSGTLSVNDSLISLLNPHLPFGGVGASGLGAYHGYHGFETFSHKKAIFKQGFAGRLMAIIYPPYNQTKLDLLKQIIRFTG